MLISVLKISIIKLCFEYTYSRPHFSRHHELDVKNKKNEIKNILTSSSAFLCDFSASDCDCDNADCNWRMTSDWRSTCQSGNTTLSVNPFHTTFFEETRKYISIIFRNWKGTIMKWLMSGFVPFALVSFLMMQSGPKFPHATTAGLSWLVQNYDLIWTFFM